MSKDKNDAKATAAKAAADRRQAERDERMRTGKAVKFTPGSGWFRSKGKWN